MVRWLLVIWALPAVQPAALIPDGLYERLLNGYDPEVHPSKVGKKQMLFTTFNLFLYHIGVPRQRYPRLKFNGFLRLQWMDDRIAWNAAEYGGVRAFSATGQHKIWTPSVIQTDRHLQRPRLYRNERSRTGLRIFANNKTQRALITQSYQIHGEMDCLVDGSFPSERLNCFLYFMNAAHLDEEQFRSISRHIMLKNMFINDEDYSKLNGWRVVATEQLKMVYGRDESTARSAIRVGLSIQRDETGLFFLVTLPFILLGVLLLGAWLTPPLVSVGICVAAVYSLMLFVDDIIGRIPIFSLHHHGLAWIEWTVLYVWLSLVLTLLFHLLLLAFPHSYRNLCLPCSRLSKHWYSFSKLESRLLNDKQDNRASDLLLEVLRLLFALLHFLVFSLLLLAL